MLVSPIKYSTTFKNITETKRSDAVTTVNEPEKETVTENKNCNNQCCHSKGINPVETTGWTAAGLLGVAMISGMTHYRTIHKMSSILGVCAVAAHVGTLYAHHHKPICDVKA